MTFSFSLRRFVFILMCLAVVALLSGCDILSGTNDSPLLSTTVEPSLTPIPPSHTPTPFIPLATATHIPPTQQPTEKTCAAGQIISDSLVSSALPKPLKFMIYLPPCYNANPQNGYPVLYLLHGQNGDQNQWANFGLLEKMDSLIATAAIPPFIVVMPGEDAKYTDEFWTTGFDLALIDDLLPYIDEHFYTCTAARCRAIGGLSRGASWAVRLGLEHWDLFGAIGGHSLPWNAAEGSKFARWIAETPNGSLPRIYLDIGMRDGYIAYANQFLDFAMSHDLPFEWHFNPGGHDNEYWTAQLETYLRWYAAAWQDLN